MRNIKLVVLMLDSLRNDAGREISMYLKESGIPVVSGTLISQSTWTLPSLVTFFSFLPPNIHGIHSGKFKITEFKKIKAKINTLRYWFPQELEKKGIKTVGISSNIIFSQYYGLSRGFEKFILTSYAKGSKLYSKITDKEKHERGSRDKNTKAILSKTKEFIENENKVFVFSLLMNLHEPYPATEKIDKRYFFLSRNKDTLISRIRKSYKKEVFKISRLLLKFLSSTDPKTKIVIFGDHGQCLGEHGYIFHQSFLYDEIIKTFVILINFDFRHSAGKERKILEVKNLGKFVRDTFFNPQPLEKYLTKISRIFSFGTSHTKDYLPHTLYNYLNHKEFGFVTSNIKIILSSRRVRIKMGEYSFDS